MTQEFTKINNNVHYISLTNEENLPPPKKKL